MNPTPLTLNPVDRVEIVTLMDNYVDVLLKSEGVVTRPPQSKGGVIPTDNLVAEHGLSMLVTVYRDGEKHSILFDAGHNKTGVPHNLEILEMDLDGIEAVVLSHAHMDHTGALFPILDSLPRPVPLVVHPEAFHAPRYFGLEDGGKLLFPNTLKREELAPKVAEIVESEGPLLLADGGILVTGEVERVTAFETGLPNAVLERDGELEKDTIKDDQALAVHLKGKGLVLISGCAHSGIVNTLLYARKLAGVEDIHAVIGGFHLTGALFEPIIGETLDALRDMHPKVLVPMHCTGWKAMNRISEAFPEAFVLNSVGSTFTLE